MEFRLVLFDADHTLFDFDRSEEAAFTSALQSHGLAYEVETSDLLLDYRRISSRLWLMFENNRVTLEELKVRRFTELFERHDLAGDPSAVNTTYLETLPKLPFLIDGALETVAMLKRRSAIGIVSNGIESVQKQRLASSTLAPHIDFLVVSENCGFAKPDPRIFEHALRCADHNDRSTTLMVGDRFETDILGAQRAGIPACWYNPSARSRKGQERPDFEVRRLHDVTELRAPALARGDTSPVGSI